jgi:hypothetical protein
MIILFLRFYYNNKNHFFKFYFIKYIDKNITGCVHTNTWPIIR